MQPYHNVSVINASFPSSIPQRSEIQTTSAYLLPSFKYVPFLPRVSFDSVQALVKGYLLPTKLHPMHDNLSPIHRDRLSRSEDQGRFLPGVQDVKDILVLICGHGGRDQRCGILGPLLRDEFERQLPIDGVQALKGPLDLGGGQERALLETANSADASRTARVGLISHIGGEHFSSSCNMGAP